MTNLPPALLSLARIADLHERSYEIQRLDPVDWATGDYVVGKVHSRVHGPGLEVINGRMIEATPGDLVVGAFGVRAATLEAEGSWQSIDPDGGMQALTAGGLFGRATSISPFIPSLIDLSYLGHVVRDGRKVTMRQFVPRVDEVEFDVPSVLLIGTSMSSGKTTSARVIIRELKRAGLRVTAMKMTGAGRYRDILSMGDSGADAIFDFVDVGLPSTVCPAEEYDEALTTLLRLVAWSKPDVVVAEAGASPLEPYNGQLAVDRIRQHVRWTVLCASDPYAVVGVTQGFGFEADLIAGVTASTSAGVAVIRKLCGIKTLNLLDPDSAVELSAILRERLGLDAAVDS